MQKELHFQILWPEKHIAQKEEYPKKKRVLQKCLAHKKTAAAVAAHTSDNCSMPAETIWKINIWTAHSNNSQMIVRHQTTRAVANNKKKTMCSENCNENYSSNQQQADRGAHHQATNWPCRKTKSLSSQNERVERTTRAAKSFVTDTKAELATSKSTTI